MHVSLYKISQKCYTPLFLHLESIPPIWKVSSSRTTHPPVENNSQNEFQKVLSLRIQFSSVHLQANTSPFGHAGDSLHRDSLMHGAFARRGETRNPRRGRRAACAGSAAESCTGPSTGPTGGRRNGLGTKHAISLYIYIYSLANG